MKKVVLLSVILAFNLQANEVKNLNDMTITAQKTEESVQDVPISMNVFDDVNIEDKNLHDLQDVSYFVPNFYLFNAGIGTFSPTIRGISADATTTSSVVGLYVDGVAITNSVGFNALLEDIQRVEVLRGPQGTLYGKNTEAGVINVVTKKPDNELAGKINLSYGEDNKQEVGLNLRTPIVKDKLFLGLTGLYHAKDGFIKNATTGDSVDDIKRYFGKIYLRATPTDRLELSLISSFYKFDDGGQKRNSLSAKDYRVYEGDGKEETKNSDQLHTFKINYEFDNFNLSSVTSYKKFIMKGFVDFDYSPAKIYHITMDMPYKSISEELKLDGQFSNVKWLFGAVGSKDEQTGGYSSDSINPLYITKSNSESTTKSYGVFTHLNYALNDKINLIGGIRYDNDKNDFIDNISNQKENQKSSNVSPKIALEYKLNQNFMTYATVAKGYKNGGFYMQAPVGYPRKYKSESLWNYEAGFKSSLFDGKMLLNSSIFYMDLSDKQVFNSVPYGGYISNAASASSYGFEIDANYALNNNFNLFASFGYAEAKFDKFSDSNGDYKDNYLSFAPKYNYAIGGTFRGFGGVYASANLRGYGKMYLDNANTFTHSTYSLVDAKIGYEWDNFDIYLYANNLFDKNYDYIGYASFVVMPEPREIGLRLTYRF